MLNRANAYRSQYPVTTRMGSGGHRLLGEGTIRPAGSSLIAEMFHSNHRGVANGIFSWRVNSSLKQLLSLPYILLQVYFGYGFSFLFGIYLTEADLLGQGWRAGKNQTSEMDMFIRGNLVIILLLI